MLESESSKHQQSIASTGEKDADFMVVFVDDHDRSHDDEFANAIISHSSSKISWQSFFEFSR